MPLALFTMTEVFCTVRPFVLLTTSLFGSCTALATLIICSFFTCRILGKATVSTGRIIITTMSKCHKAQILQR